MIVHKQAMDIHQEETVQGKGFIDTLRSVGSYILQNKI